jgi:nitrous oxide reductase accessory protein NosL
MKPITALIMLGLVLGWLLSACAPQPGEPLPPAIAYGQDLCEACGMLIDQPQMAAATLDLDGQPHKFDEIGDMVQYHAEHPTVQVLAWFVHDYDNEAWIRAETAFFVYAADLSTPMGHGLAAFGTHAAALPFAEQWQVPVLSFEEARAAMHAMDHASH